jgi:acetyl-CoA carboxylase alpha subunit
MSVWEIVELARHPERPYSLDYIRRLAPTSRFTVTAARR